MSLSPIFAAEVGGHGQNAFLVLEIARGHGDGAFGRGVEGRSGFQQRHNLAAASAGALDDGVQLILGEDPPVRS